MDSLLAALIPRPRLHLIRFHDVLAPNATLRSQIVPSEANQATDTANRDDDPSSAAPRARMRWAQLLKRVFAIAITTCPQCGAPLTILAAIDDPAMISKILSHLGLPTRAPPKAPARLAAVFQTVSSHLRIPPQFLEPTEPLCPVPQLTRHKSETCWPDPRKMSRADPTRKMNAYISGREVRGLNPQTVFGMLPPSQKGLLNFLFPEHLSRHLPKLLTEQNSRDQRP